MATYTIKVYNQTQANKSYTLFMHPPQITAPSGSPPVYSNAWATFENITHSSWDSVVYTETDYAYWSRADRGLSPGVVLDSCGVAAVNTATRDTVIFTNTGASGFLPVTSPGSAQPGSFSIVSGADFTPADGLVFGLAQDNGTPLPGPIATFPAQPNETYVITPVVEFWVVDGAFEPGEVVDVGGLPSAAVNFTGSPHTNATVVQDPQGAFTVVFD